jgi:hypothetical protein
MPALSGLSDYAERAILDTLFPPNSGGTSYSAPSTAYIALYTGGTVNEDGTLPGGVAEVSGGGYSRLAITMTGSNSVWSAATTDASGVTTKTNRVDLEWPQATANWGTVTGWAIWRTSTGGTATDLIFGGTFSTPVTINANDTLRIRANQLVIGAS